jgi:protein phosphatase PTC7
MMVAPVVALQLQLDDAEHQHEESQSTPLEEMPDAEVHVNQANSASSNEDVWSHSSSVQHTPPTNSSNSAAPGTVAAAAAASLTPLIGKMADAGASMVPHPEKAHKGGEDACFVSENRRVLVVADGVGGWAELQVDPSLFSKGLCASVGDHARDALDQDDDECVRGAIQRAYDDICDQGIEGSSTVCAAFCYPDHLIVCNLGDSGLRVIRNNELVYRSQEQVHQFNFPYQLGSRGRGEAEHPQDAIIERISTQPGDVVVMGSDGLFDNVFDSHIVTMVQDNINKSADEIAQIISQAASAVASDPAADTPFARAAADHSLTWFGGKLDDVTVVVAKL